MTLVKGKERIGEHESKGLDSGPQLKETKDLAVISQELDLALNELGVSLEGFVAEANERIKDKIPGGSATTKGDDGVNNHNQYVDWKNSLVASKPNKSSMIKEITETLNAKITKLNKEESNLHRKVTKKAYAYNDVVAQIRNVNGILERAANAGYTTLKALWLRIVYGIV